MKEDQGSRIYRTANYLNPLRQELTKKKDANSQLLAKWLDYQEAEGRKVNTIMKNLYLMLKNIDLLEGKNLTKLTRQEVEAYSLKVTRIYGVGPYRRALYYALRQFVTWAKKASEPPDEVRWLKAPRPANALVKEDMLTDEEVSELLKAEKSVEFRALWALLSSAGCRVGEALNIRVKDVKDEKSYLLVTVNGKTGKRCIPLTNLLEPIKDWLKEAPTDPDALVFNWPYSTVRSRLRSLMARVNIPKKVNPHLFRHSTSTVLAAHMPQPVLEKRMGWVHGSDMPRTYIHLSETDEVIKAQLEYFEKQYGNQETIEELEKEAMQLIWDEGLGQQLFEKALKNNKVRARLTAIMNKISKKTK